MAAVRRSDGRCNETIVSRQWAHCSLLRRPRASIHIRAGDNCYEDSKRAAWRKRSDWALVVKSLARNHSQFPLGTGLMFGDEWPALGNAPILTPHTEIITV